MTDLPPVLGKKYRAVKVLGEGGFGTVWHAIQLDLDRPVALKVLSEKALGDKDAVARFCHEAQVASKIDHANVVKVLDFGAEGNVGYIAFPLIEGCTLRDRIRQGPMAPGPAMLVAIGLADALAEIHRRGVIHRDMKPENVLLEGRDKPMLTDFGISKSAGSTVQTREGIIFGTPGYVAPEQLERETASPASDQYSLGVIVYEVLTGRRPFAGETPAEEAMARIKLPPAPIRTLLPRLDAGVAEVVMRMLAKKPESRFKDMAQVHRALQVATLKMNVAEKDGLPGAAPHSARGATLAAGGGAAGTSSVDTPLPAKGSRAVPAIQTVPTMMTDVSRISVVARAANARRRGPGWPAAALGVAVILAGATAWLLLGSGPEERPPVVPGPVTVAPSRPPPLPALVVPKQFPRIAFPDCAKLEGPGGRPTPLEVARCEVRRWSAAWDKLAGRPVRGDLVSTVREHSAGKAAMETLEQFESAAANRARDALRYLRDAGGCAPPERLDAGMLLLRHHEAHAACLWAAYGANLPANSKFPLAKVFLPATAGFYPAWEKGWAMAGAAWEDQAAILGEWIVFHRALDEERIQWSREVPQESALGGETHAALVAKDEAYVLARVWRMRVRADAVQALTVLKPIVERLGRAGPAGASGRLATLRAWAALESCLVHILSRNVASASRQAVEAREQLELSKDDPGAAKLGIAGWPEWGRIRGLGK